MKNLNDKQGQGTWNVYERTGFLNRAHKEAALSTSPARCLTIVTICHGAAGTGATEEGGVPPAQSTLGA